MKKHLFTLAALCLALTACDQHSGNKTAQNTQGRPGNVNPADYDADNTGRNLRDRNNTLTAGNQSESEVDRTITQRIRQAIMDDDSLSTNAKNIKVITVNGVVTLRGPVNNERERNIIGQKARAVNGVRNVENHIEVTRNVDNNARVNGSDSFNRGDVSRSTNESYR